MIKEVHITQIALGKGGVEAHAHVITKYTEFDSLFRFDLGIVNTPLKQSCMALDNAIRDSIHEALDFHPEREALKT